MVYEVIGIVNPDAEHVARVEKELTNLIAQVKEKETGCLSYMVYKEENEKGEHTFVIHEKFADEGAWNVHLHAPYSDNLSKTIMEEGLCSKRGMDIKLVSAQAFGFDSK